MRIFLAQRLKVPPRGDGPVTAFAIHATLKPRPTPQNTKFIYIYALVDLTGLEPVTFSMSRKRSNQLS